MADTIVENGEQIVLINGSAADTRPEESPQSLLAIFGSVAVSTETLDQSINRLVARGEQVQFEVEEMVREVLGQFRLQPQAPDPEQPLGGNLDWLIKPLGIPSQRDLRVLHSQIDQLTARIDALLDHKD